MGEGARRRRAGRIERRGARAARPSGTAGWSRPRASSRSAPRRSIAAAVARRRRSRARGRCALEALAALAGGFAKKPGLDALAAAASRRRRPASAPSRRRRCGRSRPSARRALRRADASTIASTLDRLLGSGAAGALAALRAAAAKVHTQGVALPHLVAAATSRASRRRSPTGSSPRPRGSARSRRSAASPPTRPSRRSSRWRRPTAEDEELRKAAYRAVRRGRRYQQKRSEGSGRWRVSARGARSTRGRARGRRRPPRRSTAHRGRARATRARARSWPRAARPRSRSSATCSAATSRGGGKVEGAAPLPRGAGRALRRRGERLPLRPQGPHRLPRLPPHASTAGLGPRACGRRSGRTSTGSCATTRWPSLVLDPVVTVHPDQVFFEVFSKDEGSYAKLGIDWSALGDADGEPRCGTTNIDFSRGALRRRPADAQLPRDAAGGRPRRRSKLATAGAAEVLEKKVRVPDSWLRGFLQVQSAAALPRTVVAARARSTSTTCCATCALHADRKKGGRGLRVELVPGEPPRLVLEPWELVLPTTAGAVHGPHARRWCASGAGAG